jgi:hypothetical protein
MGCRSASKPEFAGGQRRSTGLSAFARAFYDVSGGTLRRAAGCAPLRRASSSRAALVRGERSVLTVDTWSPTSSGTRQQAQRRPAGCRWFPVRRHQQFELSSLGHESGGSLHGVPPPPCPSSSSGPGSRPGMPCCGLSCSSYWARATPTPIAATTAPAVAKSVSAIRSSGAAATHHGNTSNPGRASAGSRLLSRSGRLFAVIIALPPCGPYGIPVAWRARPTRAKSSGNCQLDASIPVLNGQPATDGRGRGAEFLPPKRECVAARARRRRRAASRADHSAEGSLGSTPQPAHTAATLRGDRRTRSRPRSRGRGHLTPSTVPPSEPCSPAGCPERDRAGRTTLSIDSGPPITRFSPTGPDHCF